MQTRIKSNNLLFDTGKSTYDNLKQLIQWLNWPVRVKHIFVR